MKDKLNKMNIRERLRKSFTQIIVIFGVLSILIMGVMIYLVKDYEKVLTYYAYPQGNIALAMNYTAEVRSSTRASIGYDTDEMIQEMEQQHEAAIANFEETVEKIRPTMITSEGEACMAEIDAAWEAYKAVDAKVLALGATTDAEASAQAQQMYIDEGTPKYQALDDALQSLMAVNVDKGTSEEHRLEIMLLVCLIVMIAVIVLVAVYSIRLAATISRGIARPLEKLKDRFVTFAEGDMDTPFPTVNAEDEIADLIKNIEMMAERIKMIINDAGWLMNEMAAGNFAVGTQHEDSYTGVFNALLMGMRDMNRQIDQTLRGVNEASEQVLTGSTNLAEAAQSVAEGATDQAASVEEMQATIDELSNGIRATAEELEKSYAEATQYAKVAEASRADMEAMMEAMNRISEASEKIGEIIVEIEDIASQTNLLSLNASIEAARAGEAGRGFAVVADQIRNLAEQSAQSAVDSKELIEKAIYEVQEGSRNATKASDSLREVVDGVNKVADNAHKMKEVSLEQSERMRQADLAIERIAEIVQGNSAVAEETSATSQELTAQSTELTNMVAVFQLREE